MKNQCLDKTESLESQVIKKLAEILSAADVSLNHKVSEHDDYFLLCNRNGVPIAVWENVHDMLCGASNVFKTTVSQVRIFQDNGHSLPILYDFYAKLSDVIRRHGFEQLSQCSSPEEVVLKMIIMRDNV